MVRVVTPDPITAQRLVEIERAAFAGREIFWDVDDYMGLDGPPKTAILADGAVTEGLLVLMFAADECEILNLGVVPDARRRGLGRELLQAGMALAASRGVARMFLEVAVDNDPARALYASAGFAEVGLRRNYYMRPRGPRIDALILEKTLV